MKVSVLTENLKKGVGVAIRGISSRAQLPILSTILISAGKDGLTLSTTDLELSFRVKVRAKVSEEGEIAVPGKLFFDLIATLPAGTIEMRAEKEALVLSGDSVKVDIMGQQASEFPSLPVASGKGLTMDIGEFGEKVERVGVAAARDESRPVLSGLLWALGGGVLTLVATDGYRLGV
ncbi:DNA polymerase III subunit beta, partial [Candidatus Collierbacteria bacterium]|nr:DNA polymerase III subunit beta [Candidatus Collierbacteria bacterium]